MLPFLSKTDKLEVGGYHMMANDTESSLRVTYGSPENVRNRRHLVGMKK